MRLILLVLAAQALADPHFPRAFDDLHNVHMAEPHLQRARRATEQAEKHPKEQIGEEDEAFWIAKGDAELAKALKAMTPNTGVAKNIIIFIGRMISQIDHWPSNMSGQPI